jgi:hypothetical protein
MSLWMLTNLKSIAHWCNRHFHLNYLRSKFFRFKFNTYEWLQGCSNQFCVCSYNWKQSVSTLWKKPSTSSRFHWKIYVENLTFLWPYRNFQFWSLLLNYSFPTFNSVPCLCRSYLTITACWRWARPVFNIQSVSINDGVQFVTRKLICLEMAKWRWLAVERPITCRRGSALHCVMDSGR